MNDVRKRWTNGDEISLVKRWTIIMFSNYVVCQRDNHVLKHLTVARRVVMTFYSTSSVDTNSMWENRTAVQIWVEHDRDAFYLTMDKYGYLARRRGCFMPSHCLDNRTQFIQFPNESYCWRSLYFSLWFIFLSSLNWIAYINFLWSSVI